jgi:hypothetical protein
MIPQAIDKAVDILNRKLSSMKVTATILRNSESYNLSTGKNTLTSVEETVTGFMDSFGYTEIDNVKVLQEDVKFLILSTFEIAFDSVVDQIKIGLFTYNIVSVKKAAVGTKNILYTLQLRM